MPIPTNNYPSSACDSTYTAINSAIALLVNTQNYVIPSGSFVSSIKSQGTLTASWVYYQIINETTVNTLMEW